MFASLTASNFWLGFIANAFLVVSGISAFIWGLVKFGHKQIVDSVKETIEPRLEKIEHRQDAIYAQQVPNGGGSVRDAIDRIEKAVNIQAQEFQRHLGFHDGQDARQGL